MTENQFERAKEISYEMNAVKRDLRSLERLMESIHGKTGSIELSGTASSEQSVIRISLANVSLERFAKFVGEEIKAVEAELLKLQDEFKGL